MKLNNYLFCFSTTITFFLEVYGQTLILTATVYIVYFTLYIVTTLRFDPLIFFVITEMYHDQFTYNKKTLTAAFSLAWLEIRSRNEEAINTTRNMIYSLKVFYFLLYRRRYFLFVSELI